jgi:hypothetical protein
LCRGSGRGNLKVQGSNYVIQRLAIDASGCPRKRGIAASHGIVKFGVPSFKKIRNTTEKN